MVSREGVDGRGAEGVAATEGDGEKESEDVDSLHVLSVK